MIRVWYNVCMHQLWYVCHQSVVRCLWHPKLNQMALGCGDGQVRLYYDPKKSHRSVGAILMLLESSTAAHSKINCSEQAVAYLLLKFGDDLLTVGTSVLVMNAKTVCPC